MAQTQQQAAPAQHYETIDRLLQIPLIKDGLDYSSDVLHRYPLAHKAWERSYGLATGISNPLLSGPLNRPAHILDIYTLQLVEFIAHTFPYPFHTDSGAMYQDVKQPLDSGRQKLNTDIITPLLLQIENFVHKFIPSSPQDKRDLSPTKRTILLKNEVTDYLTSVSSDQWNRLRQNEWVDHYAEYVSDQTSSFMKAVSESRENIEGRTNDLLSMLRGEKEKIEKRVKQLPQESRKNVEPAYQKVENTYNELISIAGDKDMGVKEKAKKIGDYISSNAVPLLKSLQEAIISTEKELEKAVNEQTNHATEKINEKKEKAETRSIRSGKKGKGGDVA